MSRSAVLTVASLLSIVFFTIHLADDIVRGIEPGTLANLGGVLIAVVWLYAVVVLADRWPRTVILFLASLLASGIPVLHFRGAGVGAIAKSSGGFAFVATLLALGITALFSVILCVRRLRA